MVTSAPIRPLTPAQRVQRLRLLDTDIHNDLPSAEELRPFLANEWQPWLAGGLGLAARAYANTGSGHMDDVVRPEDGLCAGDPQWVIDKLMTPYLKRLPSEYIMHNCYFSTQPIEEPDTARHLLEVLTMLQAERTVVFASDYPHWDFDNPTQAFSSFPANLKRRIFVDNVVDLYGERLLQPSDGQ